MNQMSEALDLVLEYHQRTKHQPRAFARGPGRMDWANQPDPFRRYFGSPLFKLGRQGLAAAGPAPAPLNAASISILFFESLALSAQKSMAGSKWSLRVNPSSGNLHPTEGYLIAGPVAGLEGSPAVYHYAPQEHALELCRSLPETAWKALGLPEGTLLVALSTIYWRESWKYGERAYRYCMIDAGHALAAVGMAAACLGWQAALLDDLRTDDLARLLGIADRQGMESSGEERAEAEHPDCLVAVFTDGKVRPLGLSPADLSALELQHPLGRPNRLSAEHVNWPVIEDVGQATVKPATRNIYGLSSFAGELPSPDQCHVLRTRRSAQAMDGQAVMPLHRFCEILEATLPRKVPASLLPWGPCVSLALFVHRVQDLSPGLYLLLRNRLQEEGLRRAMPGDFAWTRPEGCPADLELRLLAEGDARAPARQSSCQQDIASDGCFAAAMITEFERPLHTFGPWFYPRLYWECGTVGQALYLAAEVAGFRGCGIGCFFDDMVHGMLGLSGTAYQDLYHFTVGRALQDPRLIALPAYD